MIRVLTRFAARDTVTAQGFQGLLLRLAKSVPAEPNNLAYEVFASNDDPNVFFCLESWSAQEDFDRHVAKNEADGLNEEAASLLAGAPATTILRPL